MKSKVGHMLRSLVNLEELDYLEYIKVHYISLNSLLNWSVFHSNLHASTYISVSTIHRVQTHFCMQVKYAYFTHSGIQDLFASVQYLVQ